MHERVVLRARVARQREGRGRSVAAEHVDRDVGGSKARRDRKPGVGFEVSHKGGLTVLRADRRARRAVDQIAAGTVDRDLVGVASPFDDRHFEAIGHGGDLGQGDSQRTAAGVHAEQRALVGSQHGVVGRLVEHLAIEACSSCSSGRGRRVGSSGCAGGCVGRAGRCIRGACRGVAGLCGGRAGAR